MILRKKFLIAIWTAAALGAGLLAIAEFSRFNSLPQATASGVAAIGGPFALSASDGRSVSDTTYRGKWEIIYFGYTNCPDICPVTLAKLTTALKALGPDASKVQALFITVDPKRDTKEMLAQYMTSFDSRIVALTGSKAQIDRVAKEYRVYVSSQASTGDDYIVAHSSYLYLMDPHGCFINVLDDDLSGEEIAARLQDAMRKTRSE